ncbi:unnamed protein product [Mycena citricolor]|uniref:AT hook domain-containing protein family protein n=1 Tax=Mycena citricolor TaxID=2018698 RepID=A0AAD2GX22_9AGAR|nr:unnamed protein product [Mycena citricolor]
MRAVRSDDIGILQNLTRQTTGLTAYELRVLNKKRSWLRAYSPNPPSSTASLRAYARALAATLVFAQEEAGTAVCIDESGLVLTCSHCVAEDADELREGASPGRMMIFADGRVVRAEWIVWDARLDLALLRIVAAEPSPHESSPLSSSTSSFPFVPVSHTAPKSRARLLCIGHPGSDDLESVVPGTKTGYDTLFISEGRFRGMCPGQDVMDNSEIGALMHDCWTYWGHSGAPLIEADGGELIGLHSSWDEDTGMRRGVGWAALQSFCREHVWV